MVFEKLVVEEFDQMHIFYFFTARANRCLTCLGVIEIHFTRHSNMGQAFWDQILNQMEEIYKS